MADSPAALAALVLKLQQRLDSLQDVVNGPSGLAAHLNGLTKVVRVHIEAEADQPTKVTPPVWSGLSVDEYDAQLRQLAVFVDQHLRVEYHDYLRAVLHNCWSQHPAAVWELGTLWAEWQRAYGDKPSLAAALTWHDRWLPGVRYRLKDIMEGCERSRCRQRSTR